MRHLICITVLLFVYSCSKSSEQDEKLSCLDRILQENNMIPFKEGQAFCMSLQSYAYDGKEIYALDNCTEDRLFNPFDCSNTYLFTKDGESDGEFDAEKYKLLSSKITYIGIVGILK